MEMLVDEAVSANNDIIASQNNVSCIKAVFSQVARYRVRGDVVAEAQARKDANRSSFAERRSQANEDWVCASLCKPSDRVSK